MVVATLAVGKTKLKESSYFLNGKVFTPPLFNGTDIKKKDFFAASLNLIDNCNYFVLQITKVLFFSGGFPCRIPTLGDVSDVPTAGSESEYQWQSSFINSSDMKNSAFCKS